MRTCFCRSDSSGSASRADRTPESAGLSSRMPACTYSASAEMRSPLAICCRMSALGLRSPRSIWLRYGLDTPAACASWRIDFPACSRCSLMYSPIEFRMPSACHVMLAIANDQQAHRSAPLVPDAEEGARFGGTHRRPLRDPGQLGRPLHQLRIAGHGTAAGVGGGVLHADPQVASRGERTEQHGHGAPADPGRGPGRAGGQRGHRRGYRRHIPRHAARHAHHQVAVHVPAGWRPELTEQPVQRRHLADVEKLELRDDSALLGQPVEVLDERPGVGEHLVTEIDRPTGQRAGIGSRVEDRESVGEAVGNRASGGELHDEVGALAQRRYRVSQPAAVQRGPGRVVPDVHVDDRRPGRLTLLGGRDELVESDRKRRYRGLVGLSAGRGHGDQGSCHGGKITLARLGLRGPDLPCPGFTLSRIYAGAARPAGSARCCRANASDSARSATRPALVATRLVLTSTTTAPLYPVAARRPRSSAHGWLPRPGTRCSSGMGPAGLPVPSARCTWARRPPSSAAMARASEPDAAVCERSSVTCGTSSAVGSQVGAYGTTSLPPALSGYMFSTANMTSVSSAISARPFVKPRTYSRCQRKGGCRTTTFASSRSARSLARRSFSHGSRPQTRWVSSRLGACTETTGSW